MNDLIGPFGLPGAAVALIGAAYLSVKFYRMLKPDGPDDKRSGSRMTLEEYQEVQKTRERIDAVATVIVGDVTKTRHDIKNAMAASQEQVQEDIDKVRDVADRIERFLLASNLTRREV